MLSFHLIVIFSVRRWINRKCVGTLLKGILLHRPSARLLRHLLDDVIEDEAELVGVGVPGVDD